MLRYKFPDEENESVTSQREKDLQINTQGSYPVLKRFNDENGNLYNAIKYIASWLRC